MKVILIIVCVWLALGVLGKIFFELADLAKARNGAGGFWLRTEPPLVRHLVPVGIGLLSFIVGGTALLREMGGVRLGGKKRRR